MVRQGLGHQSQVLPKFTSAQHGLWLDEMDTGGLSPRARAEEGEGELAKVASLALNLGPPSSKPSIQPWTSFRPPRRQDTSAWLGKHFQWTHQSAREAESAFLNST